jgi:hypothetical protein
LRRVTLVPPTSHTSQVLDVLLRTSHGEYFALTPHLLASGVTSVYLQGIDNTEVISAVRSRGAPTMPASAGLLL